MFKRAKKKPRVNDPANPFERDVTRAFEQLDTPLTNGRSIGPITLAAATPTKVSHGLSRIPSGWFVTDTTAAATIHRDSTAGERTRFLTLVASAPTTIYLWIY